MSVSVNVYWPFVKELCEARPKAHSVFKISVNLSAFSQMESLQMRLQVRLTFGQTSGQTDLWSDVSPRVML